MSIIGNSVVTSNPRALATGSISAILMGAVVVGAEVLGERSRLRILGGRSVVTLGVLGFLADGVGGACSEGVIDQRPFPV